MSEPRFITLTCNCPGPCVIPGHPLDASSVVPGGLRELGSAVNDPAKRASIFSSRDLEWEVTHKKSKIHKGRGATPEAALVDLRNGFALGLQAAREEIEREQKRHDKLTALLGDTDAAPDPGASSVQSEARGEGNEPLAGAA